MKVLKVSNIQKIAVVTATRAEYGLLSNLIHLLAASPDFELQLMVTGAHLIKEQGMTINQIKQDGFPIAAEIPILDEANQDTDVEVSYAVSRGVAGFADAFDKLKPDCVVVLGDRYEMLAICSAALLAHIPIVHLHGGEVTEGAMDEAIRHALTKLASLHFVAAEPYRKRVIQMGEQPDKVFNVGATGLDVIQTTEFACRPELEQTLQMALPEDAPLFLVTYHPVTWGETHGLKAFNNLCTAIEQFPNATVVWTAANTDVGGKALNEAIQAWSKQTKLNVKVVGSLGSRNYLSMMKIADVVLGNSSSGIIEAPALGRATVNIGERQKGRLRAQSIVDVGESKDEIVAGIMTALSDDFKALSAKKQSLYGHGDTAEQIYQVLRRVLISSEPMLKKKFYDL